jgi:TIR domain
MRVFISWSGDKSEQIAHDLSRWLPRVIQRIEPYMSSNDIEKGTRWSSEIAQQLDETDYGVVCLVPENLQAPWIQFEAGAVSKSLKKAKVSPILFGVNKADLADNPLRWFQCTDFRKEDMRKLMQDMNKAEGTEPLKSSILEGAFDKYWGDL